MQTKLNRRTLSTTLPVEDARKVEENAKWLGLEIDALLANALRPITEYPHKGVTFVTVGVAVEDAEWLRAYAKAMGYDPNNLDWLLDEAIGAGVAKLRDEAKGRK